ncbi:unnamed protein product [Brugia timori]|uniref:Uncharacterized protein n=1 Tax=Brugia timori TaxID=42155 RepID=A0A0R3R587_9BILA|nr:unnamed protein product [Brugia timori]
MEKEKCLLAEVYMKGKENNTLSSSSSSSSTILNYTYSVGIELVFSLKSCTCCNQQQRDLCE